MNTKGILTTVAILVLSITAKAQQESENYIWTWETSKKTHEVGLYGGISGTYTEKFGNSASWLGARIGVVFNQRWVIGLEGNALNYDRELTELTSEGTYRLEAGYSGAYVEYLQPLGKRFKISFNVLSGRGVAQYRYHKDFTAGLEWYEEFIDRDHFVVLQPGARFYATIGGKWWAALEASYTTTSPLQIKGAKENFLEGANVGLSINYGIF
ncbi:MAG: hypothetical protein PF489_02190 [Salinivirgaceae bacterium]|jgi:hypothetical protein|nr:hypothetical protein [Salinivirgaceae bacterium]